MDWYATIVGRGLYPFYEGVLRRRNTFRYLRECEANQWLSPDELQALQWRRLKRLLEHAYLHVPYYRQVFGDLGAQPEDIRSWDDFRQLPLIDKTVIRENAKQLLADNIPESGRIRSGTGGSTGQPLQFCYDRNSYEWRIAVAMRGDGWAGWQLCGSEYYIWGVPILPEKPWKRLKVRVHHKLLRRCVVSSFDFSRDTLPRYLAAYENARPAVVVGYASMLEHFARYTSSVGGVRWRPVGVISSAEMLDPEQRETIKEGFGAPVFDRYGCREVMMVGAECDRHEGLHVPIDHLHLELIAAGLPAQADELGEVVVTDLHNYAMPFIRYRIGDVARWGNHVCSCGRGLPLLGSVEGRTMGVLSTADGRLVSGVFFSHLFKDFNSVREYQIVQRRQDALTIRLVLDDSRWEAEQMALREAVQMAVGSETHLNWEFPDQIERTPSNKRRPTISHVPVDLAARTEISRS